MTDLSHYPSSIFTDQPPSPLGKLALALAKAQGEMESAEMDSKNPHYKSRYASLNAVREATRLPLANNHLALVQLATTNIDVKTVSVLTMLIHGESGERLSSSIEFPVLQWTPQGIGSALSYARRYAHMAITGLAAEDDDGNSASQGNAQREPERQQAEQPRQKPKAPLAESIAQLTYWVSKAKSFDDLELLKVNPGNNQLIDGAEFSDKVGWKAYWDTYEAVTEALDPKAQPTPSKTIPEEPENRPETPPENKISGLEAPVYDPETSLEASKEIAKRLNAIGKALREGKSDAAKLKTIKVNLEDWKKSTARERGVLIDEHRDTLMDKYRDIEAALAVAYDNLEG